MMRSIFSSRRQSTIEKPADLPLPPEIPQDEPKETREKVDQMPRMEIFAAKLEETCKSMLAKFDSVTTWSLSGSGSSYSSSSIRVLTSSTL